jgi:hypothetical protein
MSVIYPNEPFYTVRGFFPKQPLTFGSFNFSIGLDKDFVLRAYNTECPEKFLDSLITDSVNLIKLLGDKSDFIENPLELFLNDKGHLTYLLRKCCVPGNSCTLGINGIDADNLKLNNFSDKMLVYESHNLDNCTQAYSLLAMWLNWADTAFVLV